MKTWIIDRLAIFILYACAAVGGLPSLLQAANETWSTTAASGAWETGANWVSGNAPGANTGTTSPDVATFKTGSTSLTVLPDAGRNIWGITFDTSAVGAYLIGAAGGNSLLLSDGGVIQNTTAVNANQTFLAPLALQGNFTFTANSTASSNGKILIISNVVGTASSGTTNTLTLNGVNTGGNVIRSEIGNGTGGGSLALLKTAIGTWLLSGTNTFSGGTTLNSGTLHLNNPSAIGTGMLTLNSGTLMNSSGAGITLTSACPQTWAGDFSFAGKGSQVDPKVNWNLNLGTGPVMLTSNRTITVTGYSSVNGWSWEGATLTVGGMVSDGGNGFGVTKAGNGTVLFSGSNTFSGGVTLNAGTLSVGHNNAIGTGPLIINGGQIYNSASRRLTYNNSHYWNGNFSVGYPMSSELNLGMGGVTMSTNITITMGSGSWGTPWTVPGNVVETGGARSLTVQAGGSDAGILNLTGTNTYTGGTILKSAGIRIGNIRALGTGTLVINGGGISQTTGGAALIGISDQIWGASFGLSATSGDINLGTSPVSLTNTVKITLDNGNATFGGVISGTNSLTLQGTQYTSRYYFTGTNTFDGGVTTLPGSAGLSFYVNNPQSFGTGPLTISRGGGGTMTIYNITNALTALVTSNQYWNANFTFAGNNALRLDAPAIFLGTNVTLTVSTAALTINGPISAAETKHGLTKNGLGTLIFNSPNSYSGGTVVTNGVLTVANTGTLGSGNVYVGTNSTLRLLTSTAIDNKGTIELSTVGSKYGQAYLTNNVVEVVSGVIIGGTLYDAPGTYGSTASGAKYPFDTHFTGMGMLRIVADTATIIRFL